MNTFAFLSGALTLGFVVIGGFFVQFWRRTRDRLFLVFALAFWLFALNQLLSTILEPAVREIRYEYVLRVLGFVLILFAIAGKNLTRFRGER
jgi:hypothetical protein